MIADKQPVIKTDAITKIFRHSRAGEITALKSITLTINRGCYAVFKGHSGSGKTTLFTLLAGLAYPTAGSVFINGQNLNEVSDVELCRMRRNQIGFIFQDFHLFPHLSVLENATLPLLPLCLTKKSRHEKAITILERLGLQDRLYHNPEEMSGGEKQRLAIARGLITDPEVIFADEPTSNIDKDSADKVRSIFNELNHKGKTIMITSHRDDLLQEAGIVYELERGEIVCNSI